MTPDTDLDRVYGHRFGDREALEKDRIWKEVAGYLQRWVDAHPEDSQATQLLQIERGGAPKGGQAPPPPVLDLP